MHINHKEHHRTQRIGWLRAAVLGANDGIISTASLVLGVAAAQMTHEGILIAGVAALVAGAMSMAAGEYVSVSSQADTEKAELEIEREELATNPVFEHTELANIYIKRGLDAALAQQVAAQLMAYNALDAHARDELGITETLSARPIQAALSSAASFTIGAAMPLFVVIITPLKLLIPFIAITTLIFLAILGGWAAKIGGASIKKGVLRVVFWGVAAIGASVGVGSLFNVAV